jgi:hypothetical protein
MRRLFVASRRTVTLRQYCGQRGTNLQIESSNDSLRRSASWNSAVLVKGSASHGMRNRVPGELKIRV